MLNPTVLKNNQKKAEKNCVSLRHNISEILYSKRNTKILEVSLSKKSLLVQYLHMDIREHCVSLEGLFYMVQNWNSSDIAHLYSFCQS